MRRIISALLILNFIATVIAAGWALIHLVFGGMILYDTNLETFRFKLTEEQGTGIVRTAEGLLRGAVVPLLVTNVLWAVLFVSLYCLRNGSTNTLAPALATEQREGSG